MYQKIPANHEKDSLGMQPAAGNGPDQRCRARCLPVSPLNLEPEIESQIERVLILAGKPVMRRPIAAATVEDALPQACKIDQILCEQVERYLARFTHTSDLTHLSVEGAATHGANDALPNRY
jgi:hypothetical protein